LLPRALLRRRLTGHFSHARALRQLRGSGKQRMGIGTRDGKGRRTLRSPAHVLPTIEAPARASQGEEGPLHPHCLAPCWRLPPFHRERSLLPKRPRSCRAGQPTG